MTAGRKVNTGSVHWCTPPKYIRPVTRFLNGICLDPCSNAQAITSAETELFSGGLEYDWSAHRNAFVNPPYGRGIYDWLEKCSSSQIEVVALIPVATNTRHWKDFVFGSDVVCFLNDTRLKFMVDGSTNNKGASMACCLVYWGDRREQFMREFSEYGACMIAQERISAT